MHKANNTRSTIIASGSLRLPAIEAGKSGQLEFKPDLPTSTDGEIWLTVSFQNTQDTSWAPSGNEVAWFQHPLKTFSFGPYHSPGLPIQVSSSRAVHTVTGSDFSLTFSRSTGGLTGWMVKGHQLLDSDSKTGMALVPGFWRPPIDNDMSWALLERRRYAVDDMRVQLRSMNVAQVDDGCLRITTESWLGPPVLAWGFVATTTYTISGNGNLVVSLHLKPQGPMPADLPRMGLDLRFADAFDNAKWLGLGPGESYPDKRRSQKMGIYKATTAQLHTSYEVPQEGGNRSETRWLQLSDNRGWGIKVFRNSVDADKDTGTSFQWVASRYSAQQIETAKHPCDLVPGKTVLVRIDAETSGVGTGACGPTTLEKYLVACEERRFQFEFVPTFTEGN